MTADAEAIDALIADERLLAWENAAMLADSINVALTGFFLARKDGKARELDDPAWRIPSQSDVVLGERGVRVDAKGYRARTGKLVSFTYRQCMTMAETLGHLLPRLAMDAREARDEWATLNGIPTHAEAMEQAAEG